MPDSAIATAADYADAMLVARRAKRALVLLLLLMLLAQLALFFTARFSDALFVAAPPAPVEATTQPAPTTLATAITTPTTPVQPANKWVDPLKYLIAITDFVGVTASIVLAAVLLLLVGIMLVGRLIGVARVTSAFVWCLILIVMLFPWQAFLNSEKMDRREFIIPGVLYTWDEFLVNARFENGLNAPAILKWARFAGFPIAAVLILFSIEVKSNRGLRQALGEDDLSALGA